MSGMTISYLFVNHSEDFKLILFLNDSSMCYMQRWLSLSFYPWEDCSLSVVVLLVGWGGAELYVFNIYSILVNIFILFSIFAATLLIFVCLCLFSSSFIVLVDSSSWIFLPFSNMCCVSVPLLQGSLYFQHCCSCIKYDTDWLCLKHHS